MRNYIKTLEKLDNKDTLLEKQDKYVVLLSGQSHYAHSELLNEQKELLRLISRYGYTAIETGFPYNKNHNFQNCERAGVLIAS